MNKNYLQTLFKTITIIAIFAMIQPTEVLAKKKEARSPKLLKELAKDMKAKMEAKDTPKLVRQSQSSAKILLSGKASAYKVNNPEILRGLKINEATAKEIVSKFVAADAQVAASLATITKGQKEEAKVVREIVLAVAKLYETKPELVEVLAPEMVEILVLNLRKEVNEAQTTGDNVQSTPGLSQLKEALVEFSTNLSKRDAAELATLDSATLQKDFITHMNERFENNEILENVLKDIRSNGGKNAELLTSLEAKGEVKFFDLLMAFCLKGVRG